MSYRTAINLELEINRYSGDALCRLKLLHQAL